MKVGPWLQSEFGLYAREELHSGRVFVLFVGQLKTGDRLAKARVEDYQEAGVGANNFPITNTLSKRMSHCSYPTIFHAILPIIEEVEHTVQAQRWRLEYRFEGIKQKDHGSKICRDGSDNMLLHASARDKDWRVMVLQPRTLLWATEQYMQHIQFLLEQLERYQRLPMRVRKMSYIEHEALQDSYLRHLSLFKGYVSTFSRLMNRYQFDFDVNRGVVAERDSDIMRKITVVTIFFLPATFFATFFSMVFFHVGDEDTVELTVIKNVWLYFRCCRTNHYSIGVVVRDELLRFSPVDPIYSEGGCPAKQCTH